MRIKFLGTGTSTGVPEIGCRCDVCLSSDPRDNRLRASVMIDVDEKVILIDCGPDFREQILTVDFRPINAVLLTHEHYDHVAGLDDLRPFCKFGDINVYAETYVADAIRNRIPYCFLPSKYPGVPNISLHNIGLDLFSVEGVEIIPIRLLHGSLPILGYRIQDFAYLTDLKEIPEEEFDKLKNLEVLVIDALRIDEHVSHQNLEQALKKVERIGAKRTYLTHMSHHMGLHAHVEKILPNNVFLAFDRLEIEI